MKTLNALLISALLATGPAYAEEGQENLSEGMQLLQEGTRLLLEGLMQELGPALKELEDRVIDLNSYHAPEVLPNGDIIIRRKTPLEVSPSEEGEIEL